jgi:hypothetical protein
MHSIGNCNEGNRMQGVRILSGGKRKEEGTE